jgi:hypothetical protein
MVRGLESITHRSLKEPAIFSLEIERLPRKTAVVCGRALGGQLCPAGGC